MKLLDLFCGAGGASAGYARAGFDVSGVDNDYRALRQYPYPHRLADAMDILEDTGKLWQEGWDVIHASPPCQAYSPITGDREHVDLVASVREALQRWGGPWIIENVPGAPLDHPVLICAQAMGLPNLRRHRLFESNVPLMSPGCACSSETVLGVYGTGGGGYYPSPNRGGGTKASITEGRAIMGIDWMGRAYLSQAIPPAYTEYVGSQLMDHLRGSLSV